jgi:hypothetical protein
MDLSGLLKPRRSRFGDIAFSQVQAYRLEKIWGGPKPRAAGSGPLQLLKRDHIFYRTQYVGYCDWNPRKVIVLEVAVARVIEKQIQQAVMQRDASYKISAVPRPRPIFHSATSGQ